MIAAGNSGAVPGRRARIGMFNLPSDPDEATSWRHSSRHTDLNRQHQAHKCVLPMGEGRPRQPTATQRHTYGCVALPKTGDLVGFEDRATGDALKAALRLAVLVTLLLGACTSSAAPTILNDEEPEVVGDTSLEYVAVSDSGIVLKSFEEDWCNRLEGRAGGWLVADESELVMDSVSGETFSLDPESRSLLITVVSEGTSAVAPDELVQLDTFLRFPVPSALACRTAYEGRDK